MAYCRFGFESYVFLLASFVEHNLATGLWEAVFNTNTQQQKSSHISVTA
jgi:hypothetical protein